MFSKAKMGLMMGALATVLSVGTVSGVYAATNDQGSTEQAAKQDGKQKVKLGWFHFKGEGKDGEGKFTDVKFAEGKFGEGKVKVLFKGKGPGNNEELLKLLNLSADELKEALKADKSLAEVAKEQGVSTEDVVNLLVKQQKEQLAEAVKAGKLTQEQADKVSENAAEHVQKMVESKHEGREKGAHGFFLTKGTELLDLLKLDEAGLQAQLKEGKSLADIAKAQGVSTEDVVSLIVKQQENQLAEAVKAGKLTQEQADKMSENAKERVQKMVESTHEGREKGPRLVFSQGKNTELLDLLKLDAEQLATEMKAGKSLADIAEAQGVDVEDVIALLTKQREDQLAEAVKAGKIPQEKADKLKADLEGAVKKQVEHKWSGDAKKVVVEE
ncbi:hypothetical protein NDK47_06220 [Brevibacillus ruminantium]|uniref:Uncharacterized protein n=1 Tax=Brevibacillus ruminantium TaxID=2950604 RepID=A0ABY4WNA6_9BACL|nr:hypothetical protein [Brevibacillus ruminantium]USG66889.1 hypothetical protein NDK47_06220 [Brevibacillus ruminantium]